MPLQNSINQQTANLSIIVDGSSPFFTAVGSGSLDSSSGGTQNSAFGYESLGGLTNASNCTAVGYEALFHVTSNGNSTAVGNQALTKATGTANTALGHQALQNLVGGADNIGIGPGNGSAYTGIESNNVIIGFNLAGTLGESNAIRLGNSSATTCFLAGISGVSQTKPVVTIDTSTGQLGTAAGIITAPVASSTATTAFGTSLTVGTTVHNTTGYDILVNISASVTTATGANFNLGVGPSSPPTVSAVTGAFTLAAAGIVNFTAIVPNNYFLLVTTTGTITVASVLTQACPL